jgi:FAD/FMN-containing dehydrogenase
MRGQAIQVKRRNFGRNQVLTPSAAYTPANEQEVLEILDRHHGQRIRAIGRLHSWSEAAVTDSVLLDLRRLNSVQLQADGNQLVATVGAGCQVKRLLRELSRQDATLLSLGLITEQTIAGAISTGTHGSGRHSMSHYVVAVRIARYDPSSGSPIIEEITAGEQLQAARCSLGSLGIILSVKILCRPTYHVEEHFRKYRALPDVLAAEASFPLQQFYLIPWRWAYFSQHRREVDQPRSRLADLYRLYWLLVMDLGMHLLVIFLAQVARSRRLTRFFLRRIVPAFVIRNWKVTDHSSAMLVMKHEAFRHIEIELFVRRDQLLDALGFTRQVITLAGGKEKTLASDNQNKVEQLGMTQSLTSLQGQYCHHYPICVRRVLPDDTLVSMASGEGEEWYALSFISYARPEDRAGFFLFASFMARSMSRLFGARPHWGKVCPLTAGELASLYPRFDLFRSIAHSLDPAGAFRNRWTAALLRADKDTPETS